MPRLGTSFRHHPRWRQQWCPTPTRPRPDHSRGAETPTDSPSDVPLPWTCRMPAGVAMQSPGFDHQEDGFPSWYQNVTFDLFPDVNPTIQPGFLADAAWPTDPPRANFYCDASVLCHPLVSPVAAKSWTGAPPMYIGIGSTERNVDSTKIVAQTAARQGVKVIWDEYELMPHNRSMVLRSYPQSAKCHESWAAACLRFVSGKALETSGTFTE